MKIWNRLGAVALIVAMVMSMTTVAFATEVSVNPCQVAFTLTDESGELLEDVTVLFKDTETGDEYLKLFNAEEYLAGYEMRLSLIEGRTYSVTFDYPSKSKGVFEIVNEDGAEILPFTATGESMNFKWIIRFFTPSDTPSSEYVASDVGNEEAQALLQSLLDEVAKQEKNELFQKALNSVWSVDSTSEQHWYEVYCYGDASEWDDFTSLEKMLWYELYVEPCMKLQAGRYDKYLASINLWHSNVTKSTYDGFVRAKAQGVADAYLAFMDWQYNYIVETGTVFNVMTGKTLSDARFQDSVDAEPAPDEVAGGDTVEVIEDLTPDETEDPKETVAPVEDTEEPVDEQEEKGIWDDTISKLKDNIFTIGLIIVSCGALLVMFIIRKRKNMDED